MRFRLAWLSALFLLSIAGAVHGQDVDERYVEIYNMIQRADAMSEAGQKAEALGQYTQAASALKSLQVAYPLWNEKVVAYRLNYLAGRLSALGPSTNAPAPMVESEDLGSAGSNQLRQAKEELSRLQGQNTLLEAKLKEALSVQPAAIDPRQLARAEQRASALEKERDLLRVSLEQEKARIQPPADPTIMLQEQRIISELKQRLTEQVEIADSLQRENNALRTQLDARLVPGNTGTTDALQLQLANATIAALRSTNISLRTERILLEERLAQLARTPTAEPRETTSMRKLREERDDYKRRLDLALAELSRKNNATPALGSELEVARARLSAYEAQQVPYTPEELALFKPSDLRVDLHNSAPVPRKVYELPPGAGPLMADAQKAIEAGRFADAERTLQQVLRQDPRNIYVLANLASVQIEQKQNAQAEETIRRALAVEPNDPASLFLLGRLKYDQQHYDEALNALSLSARLLPDEARTQYYLGKTLTQKGNRGPAEAALRRAVQLKPGWGDAHHSLAVVYATQNPPFIELAQWHYQKALAGGFPRDGELEKWLESKKGAASAP